MVNEKTNCLKCGQIMSLWMKACPACNAPTPKLGQTPIDPPAVNWIKEDGKAPDPEPVLAPPLPSLQVFPERMKANRVLAERLCSSCLQAIDIGEDVWNCQSCGNTMHAVCQEQSKLCGNTGCPSLPKVAPAKPLVRGRPAAVVPSGELVPCKSCGEMILAKSYRCRFCDDYQNESDRKNATVSPDDPDSKLSVVEIIFGLMCGLPALIMGVVWMVQGKPKGLKMVLLSLTLTGISVILRLLSHH